jgi:hypothetical protein
MQCVPDRAGAPHSQLSAVGSWLPLGRGVRARWCKQNSLPSGSCITIVLGPRSACSSTTRAPSAASRSASAVLRSSSTRTSRLTRFLLVLPSGTRWKKSRGSTPAGSEQAATSRNADRPATVIMSPAGSGPVATGQLCRVAATDGATNSGRQRTERFSAIMIPCPVGREIYR